MPKDLTKNASQGHRSVVSSRLYISIFKDLGALGSTPVCRELVCLDRTLKNDLNNKSDFFSAIPSARAV